MSQAPPNRPATFRVKIFEVDRRRPLERGSNPKQIDIIDVPWVEGVDARGDAAREAVLKHTRRRPAVRHLPHDEISATIEKDPVR